MQVTVGGSQTTNSKPKFKEGFFVDAKREIYADRHARLWVDATTAARVLGLTTDQIYRAVRAGKCSVRFQRIGSRLVFNARDLGLYDDQPESKEESGTTDKAFAQAFGDSAL